MKSKEICLSVEKKIKKRQDKSSEIEKITKKFIKFLKFYRSIDNFKLYYPTFLKKKLNGILTKITIDLFHIAEFDPYLYLKIIDFPTEMLTIFDFALTSIFLSKNLTKKIGLKKKVRISFTNSMNSQDITIDSISPKNLNKLLTLKGIVVKHSTRLPVMTSAFFRCEICSFETFSFIERGKLIEPVYCYCCKNFHSFKNILNRSNFSDKQFISLQEIRCKEENEHFPLNINLVAYDENTDKVRIGQRIEVTGILRISENLFPINNSPNRFFNFYIDILDLKIQESPQQKKRKENSKKLIKPEKKIHSKNDLSVMLSSLSQNLKIYQVVSDSILPSLFGFETVKQGIILQLINDISIKFSSKQNFSTNSFNILLMGKLNEEKSKILNFVQKIIKKDAILDGKEIKANEHDITLPFASKRKKIFGNTIEKFFPQIEGILCVEEFQKIPNDLLNFLQETMVNSRISIAKAGMVYTMKSKLSILGSMNFDENLKNNENEIFKDHLILEKNFFGFHLFYWLKDPFRASLDKKLACNVLKYFTENFLNKKKKEKISSGIGFKDKSLFFFLNNFSKKDLPFFHKITFREEAKWQIINKYLNTLKFSKFYSEHFSIQNILIEISKAISLLRFSNVIGICDIRYGVVIFLEALKSLENFSSSIISL
ncbi:mcm4 (nucleomorph) [Hemiselmis andersenii]|uniref:DNA replication licensing factor MCM4 n=1 Tax=Hemiselmis andersenii TaxID=464988 RepID=A9BLA8_HEMAN|nr:mcm4 [Hemiselmis andersenii]ABW98291.1 mcm4 [Hemiselmis andersenii]|mmetsp:Transcript_27563/g.67131  ORF Transcript_27563/g.67131 Transcript_27563/m.67131 type:complete len:657 (+) Transcript_27563:57-2027(+)